MKRFLCSYVAQISSFTFFNRILIIDVVDSEIYEVILMYRMNITCTGTKELTKKNLHVLTHI